MTRIEVASKIFDTRAKVLREKLTKLGLLNQKNDLRVYDVYTIDKNFTEIEIEKIAAMLSNPVTQSFVARKNSPKKSPLLLEPVPDPIGEEGQGEVISFAIEIGFLPGVTDNVANTTKEGIEDLLKIKFAPGEDVYTSQLLQISGNTSEKKIHQIAEVLYNPLIQRLHIKDSKTFSKDGGMDFIIPRVTISETPKVTQVNLDVSDEELKIIGKSVGNHPITKGGTP